MSLCLTVTSKVDKRLKERMEIHYSQPKGFVGRSICYAIIFDGVYYGHIIGGSATRHLPGRNEYLKQENLNSVVNNIFYNVSKVGGKYPKRNFTTYVLECFMEQIIKDWERKYGDKVVGFESLVELPRTGELYRRAGFKEVGVTKGYTCKRGGGRGTDNWSGKRIWNTAELKPKLVFCKRIL